jgi:hypothetical protein
MLFCEVNLVLLYIPSKYLFVHMLLIVFGLKLLISSKTQNYQIENMLFQMAVTTGNAHFITFGRALH